MSLIGYTAAGNSLNLSYLPPSFVYRFMWRQYASLAYSHNRDARGHGITWRANANILLRPQYTLVVRVTPDPVTRIMWQASRESRLTSVLCVYIDESGRYDRFKEFPAAVYSVLGFHYPLPEVSEIWGWVTGKLNATYPLVSEFHVTIRSTYYHHRSTHTICVYTLYNDELTW